MTTPLSDSLIPPLRFVRPPSNLPRHTTNSHAQFNPSTGLESHDIELGNIRRADPSAERGESSHPTSPSSDPHTSSSPRPQALLPLLDDERDEDDDPSSPHMKRKGHGNAGKTASQRSSSEYTNGSMTSPLEHRHARKYSIGDGSTASQVQHLMNSARFSLDRDPPRTPTDGDNSGVSVGFFDLPQEDRKNFMLLVLLYFLQGIPMGLAGGSVPFLLKNKHVSYGAVGIFSLVMYPYSLKLLWSPIVDAIWSRRMGRRKSWIVPVQFFSGIVMIILGARVKGMMQAVASGGEGAIWGFTLWFFFLVFTCATQDIAVDGWALTLLSHENIAYASTAQTVGLTGGQFFSYTVFLAFNSPDFANKWFRAAPSDEGLMTLGGYLVFWGWAYIIVTIGLAVFKREEKTKTRDGILEVYKVMGGILTLRNVQTLIIIHLIAKIGFQANDAVTNLKLLDKGFSQEDLALTVLIDFPFELGLGYYAGKWSSGYPPMAIWCWAFIARIVAAAFAQFTVMLFPAGGTTTSYLCLVIFTNVFSVSTSTIMFVAIAAFHAKIADPVIGGTYMTMLATVSNLGGTFPRYFILKLVDVFTVATCVPPTVPPKSLLEGKVPVTSAFPCSMESEKQRCRDGGGTCQVERDGYYVANAICILIGLITFFMYVRPKALALQRLPLKAWRRGER